MRSQNRSGSLHTIARGFAKYILGSLSTGSQTRQAGSCTAENYFLYGKLNENQLGTGFFFINTRITANKGADFVSITSCQMSYIVLGTMLLFSVTCPNRR